MLDLTFLSKEQVFGDNSLEIFKKIWKKMCYNRFCYFIRW